MLKAVISFLEDELANKLHVVKAAIIAVCLYVYFRHDVWCHSLYPDHETDYAEYCKYIDAVLAIRLIIAALLAQGLAISGSRIVRFFAGMAIAWFLSDAFIYLIPHKPTDVTERHTCDYLVMTAVLILGCVHYYANTKLFFIILKWPKK